MILKKQLSIKINRFMYVFLSKALVKQVQKKIFQKKIPFFTYMKVSRSIPDIDLKDLIGFLKNQEEYNLVQDLLKEDLNYHQVEPTISYERFLEIRQELHSLGLFYNEGDFLPEIEFNGMIWLFNKKEKSNHLGIRLATYLYTYNKEYFHKNDALNYLCLKKTAYFLDIHQSTLRRFIVNRSFLVCDKIFYFKDFFLSRQLSTVFKKTMIQSILLQNIQNTKEIQKWAMKEGVFMAIRTINKYKKILF